MSDDPIRPMMQTVAVLRSDDFVVSEGVAEGEGISFADELVMDDVYQLSKSATRLPLSLSLREDAEGFEISETSTIGKIGNAVYLDSCVTMMATDSTTYEVLVLVEVEDGGLEATYLLPLANLTSDTNYRLVGVDKDAATTRFAEVASVSFTRGTHITMASGEQRAIEDLVVGDKVLTRDDGPQAVRWVGQSTLRAVGEFAPIVITKGALHNENDLLVSPDHRLFIYQRSDALGAGRHELLVRARYLVNGDTVSFILFGGLLIWALVEMAVINAAEGPWTPPPQAPVKKEIVLVVITLLVFAVVALIHNWLGYSVFG